VRIDRLDHLVLTMADIGATMDFYTQVLGMRAATFGAGVATGRCQRPS
jgi:catechol 2,3-dioxygenase-like lactoylglutathione lyase family enzyme